MANVERLIEARDWALNNPSHFDMGAWTRVRVDAETNACKTTMCLAGYAASRAVGEKEFLEEINELAITVAHDDGIYYSADHVVVGEDHTIEISELEEDPISEVGREWLGLSQDEADHLFHSGNGWLEVLNVLIESKVEGGLVD
jgi:hypothetical protein